MATKRLTRRVLRLVAVAGIVSAVAIGLTVTPGAAKAGDVSARTVVPKGPRTVLFYGDSLSHGSTDYIEQGLRTRRPDWTPIVRAMGGTAICDFFPAMLEDIELHPDLVVIEFTGNHVTECMDSVPDGSVAALQDKYRQDAMQAARIWADVDVPVLFLGTPRPFADPLLVTPHPLDEVYEQVAASFRDGEVMFSDLPERALTVSESDARDAAVFPDEMPCLPSERDLSACNGGYIQVRAPDGLHFCPAVVPDPVSSACPVYSSGSLRFGDAIAQAAVGVVR